MRTFQSLVGQNPRQKVIDVGAFQISGDPVYAPLLRAGNGELVGFEPNLEALGKLHELKVPNATYLPHAIGDGRRHTFHVCNARDMSSLFAPNPEVLNLFHGFPVWSQVIATEEMDTARLDDIPQTKGATFMQLDIQGAELMALQNARDRLRDALVLHVEVEFMPLYKNQPLFSDVERYLRDQGFILHKFSDMKSRIVAPMLLNNDIFAGLSQTLWADAVFIRDISRLAHLSPEQLLASAAILHDCYQSVDITLHHLLEHDRRCGTQLGALYMTEITKPEAPPALAQAS